MLRGAGIAAALGLAAASAGHAQPVNRAQEAAAMLSAAGFQIRGDQILNPCGQPAQPRPTAMDMNGDGRAEAIVADTHPTCYGPTGLAFSVIQQQGPARWTVVGAGRGRIKVLETRTNGWRDYTLEGPGCQRVWNYTAAQGYISARPCPGESGHPPPGAPPPAPPAKAVSGTPADRAAAFRAAGVAPTRGRYLACDTAQEQEIEIRDLNGDGRPDAVITDFGTYCYGNTGQGFTIVTKEATGAWRQLFQSQGVPDFLTTRGVGGWPDIMNGGPGLCFPVLRWNGRDYVVVRLRADPAMPNACAGRR